MTEYQYPRTDPFRPFHDIIGAALATNSVALNGQTIFHKWEYFWGTVETNNTASPAWLTATVASGGHTNAGSVYLAQTPEQFSYDADGNLTNDGRWAYTWDAENRLAGMTVNINVGPQYQLSFVYDSKGRRIQKLVVSNSVAIYTNSFLYDGWNLLAETAPNNLPIRTYVWGNDLSGSIPGAGGVGGLLEVSYYGNSTTNCFPAFDGNGNLAELVNAGDGTSVGNYEYGPFGEVIRSTGCMAKTNPFRFSTKYADDESDLLYYGYRYYKASTGTWVNRDPLEERGGRNLYAFVRNNPVSKVDVLGRYISPAPYPNPTCFYCKCKSVAVTGKPVAPPGVGFYLGNGVAIYGNQMTVNWTVDGDPSWCNFEQNEKGYSTATPLSGQPPKNPSNYGNHSVGSSYTDYMGAYFTAPTDDGDWDIFLDLHIDFVCKSSDGSKMTGAHLDFFKSGTIHF
jgi:RHS repeat-associated protein